MQVVHQSMQYGYSSIAVPLASDAHHSTFLRPGRPPRAYPTYVHVGDIALPDRTYFFPVYYLRGSILLLHQIDAGLKLQDDHPICADLPDSTRKKGPERINALGPARSRWHDVMVHIFSYHTILDFVPRTGTATL